MPCVCWRSPKGRTVSFYIFLVAFKFQYFSSTSYVNMDYIYLSSSQQNVPRRVITLYNIACQWIRNLLGQCEIYLSNLLNMFIINYLIPKFHLPAHQVSCHTAFSFNYTPNVGHTDREAPERGWAAMNPVANSTKEMGPGS
jgi:hypothetical protein